MSDRYAKEILQLGEFLQTLAQSVKSIQGNAQQLVRDAVTVTEQLHTASRRLRVLEHAAGIVSPPVAPPDTEDQTPKQQH